MRIRLALLGDLLGVGHIAREFEEHPVGVFDIERAAIAMLQDKGVGRRIAGYLDTLMRWLDSHSASYVAWAWNADFNCASGPSLITSYSGSATVPGAAFRSHLLDLARG